jgi:hypothetical protein
VLDFYFFRKSEKNYYVFGKEERQGIPGVCIALRSVPIRQSVSEILIKGKEI